MERKAKIIATMGPATSEVVVIKKLVTAGMNIARLNFSHGTHELHAATINKIRSLEEQVGHPIAILQDLQGPKIRVGALERPLELKKGQFIQIYPTNENHPSDLSFPVDFLQLFSAVKTGSRILLDDGRLVLLVTQVGKDIIGAEVITGGRLTSHKGINLPGISLDIPAFTDKDSFDLAFGLLHGVDYIAMSFVQTAEDIKPIREKLVSEDNDKPLLIAKLERPKALENLEEILSLADGVMIARGDLGVEMDPEVVPGTQKKIIQAANRMGKIVITATQMLESMIHNPLPTRAEASDVANAIYDGTDVVMLSGETAMGDYPVESVSMMNRIVCQAEEDYSEWGRGEILDMADDDDAVAIVHAARDLAHDRDVEAIAVFTRSGRTAVLMSKTKPLVPILAFTPIEKTYRKLVMAWGVTPYLIPWADTMEDMILHVEKALKSHGLVKAGGQVVVVSSFPVSGNRLPNMAMLHTIR